VKGVLTKALRGVDGAVTRAAALTPVTLVWPGLIAAAAAAGAWAYAHSEHIAKLGTNKVTKEARAEGLQYAAAAAATVVLFYLAVIIVTRLASGSWKPLAVTSKLNRLFSFVLTAPLVMDEEGGRWRKLLEKAAPFIAALVVAGIWLGYSYFFSRLAITQHQAFGTRTIDLGYYDNIFYQSIHGRPLACSLLRSGTHASAHFDPILVVMSPLYLIYPRAELLLSLQSVWLGSGAIPAYLLGKHHLDSRQAGIIMAIVYALYPALHGANMYEFHSLSLIAMPMLWVLYFLEKKNKLGYFVMLGVLLSWS